MTVVTTDELLARFAVEMAAGRTAMPTEITRLEDGWLVRNPYIELTQDEVRREYAYVQAEAAPRWWGDASYAAYQAGG